MKRALIRVTVLVLAGAIGVGVAVAFKQARKAEQERAMLAELLLDLGAVEADGAARAYIDGLARAAHAGAVAQSFTPGGFTGGTYDVNLYQRTAVDWMIAQARADGSGHIAAALELFKVKGTRLELTDPAGGE